MSLPEVPRRAVLTALAAVPVLVAAQARATPAHAEETGGVLRVSSLGHDLDDSTRYLQEALDSDAATVIIDKVPGGWTSDPLFLRRSNVRVIFEPGVTVQARTPGFSNLNSRLLQVENCANVTISGYGATLRMDKPSFRDGEWRNAMRLYAVENATIEGLTLRDSGGDGISVTGGNGTPSRNIVLRDLVCDNNRRNGLSVANAAGMDIVGCAFLNSNGTPPRAGVDFEPDTVRHELTSVRMQDCWISGNVTAGLTLVTSLMDATSTAIDVKVERTTIGRQVGGSPQVMVWGSTVGGSFELTECLIDVKHNSSAFGTLGQPDTGVMSTLTRTSIWNIGNPFVVYESICFESRGRATYGNLAMADCVMAIDQPPLFLRARTPTSTLHNVTGDITVITPHGAEVDYGPNPVNVDLTVTVGDPSERARVQVVSLGSTVTGGSTARFRFSRISGSTSRTLAIAYETCGSAKERYDYGGLGKVVTIPPGKRYVDLTIPTHARHDSADPVRRNLVLAIASGPTYTAEGRAAQVEIRN